MLALNHGADRPWRRCCAACSAAGCGSTWSWSEPGLRVRADPTALDQVLLNLAVNARDAMPGGGVLTLRSGHITLYRPLLRGPETIPPGRYVMIEVQDTGIGIPPEALAHIFEPFFTTRREQGGTGLGLATVHGIVRQSDGFLGVESAPGQGTRLRVYLPRWDGDEVAIPAPPARPRPPGGAGRRPAPARPARVLLVEDEPAVRAGSPSGRWRGTAGRCWRPSSAEAALALLADGPPPAARRDRHRSGDARPGRHRAGARGARTTRARRRLPAILVSGYAAEELQREVTAALGEAGTLFLPKPYDMAELAARLLEITSREVSTRRTVSTPKMSTHARVPLYVPALTNI